jgi:hypothetical protein
MDAFMTGWLGEMSLGWAVLTFTWVVLLAYRAWLASREEEQMYLGSTPSPGAQEQGAISGKLIKLAKPLMILGILDGALTLLIVGLWLWQGMNAHV